VAVREASGDGLRQGGPEAIPVPPELPRGAGQGEYESLIRFGEGLPLLAAIYLAEHAKQHGFPTSEREQKRSVNSVMQRVAKQLGNTPAVTRESYLSPGVIEHYLEGRTIDDFRPRHLRVVKAREAVLTPEEQAMCNLLRSRRRRSHKAA
jgi:DNA topoisomerase I